MGKNEGFLISIITVCFNSESTIKDTFESILKQSYRNLEYIIIDGGSTDKTLEMIKAYEIKFFENGVSCHWISEKDKGLYDAMNKGISKASGALIGFLNSDDWYEDDALCKIVKQYDSNIGIIHGNLILCHENKLKSKPLKPLTKKKSYLIGTPFLHPACFFNRSQIIKTNLLFNLDYKIAADYDFMIKLIQSEVIIKYIDENIGYFREGGISTTENLSSLYESHKVRVDNGVNKSISYVVYLYRVIRNYIGSLLRRF